MTKDEVIWLLKAFIALCGQSSVAAQKTNEAIDFINQQAEQIERLKCCGNCGKLCESEYCEGDGPCKCSKWEEYNFRVGAKMQ